MFLPAHSPHTSQSWFEVSVDGFYGFFSSGKKSLSRSVGRVYSRGSENSPDVTEDEDEGAARPAEAGIDVASTSSVVVPVFPRLERQNAMSRRHESRNEEHEASSSSESSDVREDDAEEVRYFTQEELYAACNGFSTLLGSGSFGDVFLGQIDAGNVAVKRVKESVESPERFIQEVSTLMFLDHPKVVRLIGCCINPEFPCIVMEYMAKGTLADCLTKSTVNKFHWSDRFSVFCDICEGLDYLHSRVPVVLHCDLKPQNIFLNKHGAKIGDTGLARKVYLDDQSYIEQSKGEGTYGYADPNFIRSGKLGPFSDIYSLGMVLRDILFGMGGDQSFQRKGYFYECVKKAENKNDVLGLVDVTAGNWPKDLTLKLLEMMIWCTQFERENRPRLEVDILPLCALLKAEVEEYRKQSEEEKRRRLDEERSRNYFCPITQDLMKEPVVAADGFCYEKSAIEAWLKESNRSPMTNLALPNTTLHPSNHMQAEIRDYLEKGRSLSSV